MNTIERGMRREGGAVLFVALIMLLLMTLLAVAAMRLTTTNLQAIGNEQFATEAQAAADFALDQTVNNKDFIDIPILTQKVSLTQADSTLDPSALPVTLSVPACERYRLIKKNELVTPAAAHLRCRHRTCPALADCHREGLRPWT